MLSKHDQYTSYNIILGSSCNWKCPYCIQSDDNCYNKSTDVNVFCDKLIDHLTQTNKLDYISRFNIWGGEPLLYYNELAILIKRLSGLKARQKIRIVSNGSLLNSDNYKLFNDYPTHLAISYHDGQLTDDKWKIAMNVEDMVVSSIAHGQRLSWEPLYDKWQELYLKFGRCIKWYVFPIIDTGIVPDQYQFTYDKIDCYFNNLYSYLGRLDNVFYRTALHGLIYEFSKRGLERKFDNPCFNDNIVAIDLKGNRYLCHHDCSPNTIVGNIFEGSYTHNCNLSPQPFCYDCKAYNYCLGGCFRLRSRLIYCYYNRKMVDFLNTVKSEYSQYIKTSYCDLIL